MEQQLLVVLEGQLEVGLGRKRPSVVLAGMVEIMGVMAV
jgi:hypothetical protein